MSRTSTTALSRHRDDTAGTEAEASELWWDAAACRFFGPAPFFAPDDETPGQRARREHTAKLICRPCPARSKCLQHALTTGERHGVWGGATERERDNLKVLDQGRAQRQAPATEVLTAEVVDNLYGRMAHVVDPAEGSRKQWPKRQRPGEVRDVL